jgi:hypothetical protein
MEKRELSRQERVWGQVSILDQQRPTPSVAIRREKVSEYPLWVETDKQEVKDFIQGLNGRL